MDVSLAINGIEERYGLQGYKRKSSMLSQKTDVVDYVAYV